MNPTPPRSSSSGGHGVERPPPKIPDHEILRRIGGGSYGEVWLARNIMGTWRAVKVVYRSTFEEEAPFEREYRGIRRFEPVSRSHPSQVNILHVGRAPDRSYFYYVMELADDANTGSPLELAEEATPTGVGNHADREATAARISAAAAAYVPMTLKWVLGRRHALPTDECLEIGLGLATALEHLHKHRLVHRDIKPSNIIFSNGMAKLADIGLVAEMGDGRTFVGTEGYVPREGPGEAEADIYALGMVLYEMLTGLRWKQFPKVPDEWATAPDGDERRELNLVVMRACEADPKRRCPSAVKLHEELLLLRSGKSIKQLRALERRVKRMKQVAMWVGVVAVLGLLVAAWQLQRMANFEMQEKVRELAREQGRANAQMRGKLLADAKALGGDQRATGWITNAIAKVREAVRLHSGDDARDAAAATLVGTEARLLWQESNAAASSLAWDANGRRLLIGGYVDGRVQTPTRIVVPGVETNFVSNTTNGGPVAWMGEEQPVQLRQRQDTNGDASFYVRRVFTRTNISGVTTNARTKLDLTLCTLSADGSRAAGAFRSRLFSDVVVWDIATDQVLVQTNLPATALAFTPDGRLLAVGLDDGNVTVFGLPRFDEVATLQAEDNAITSLAFQRDFLRLPNVSTNQNWRLAAGDRGSFIFVWELAKRRQIARLRGSNLDIQALAFNPDGTLLASGGRHQVRLWDVANERQVLMVDSKESFSVDYLQALAFSPDGTRLAGGSRQVFDSAYTWVAELSPHRGVQPLFGLNGRIERVWLSGDNRYIGALSQNWRLGVWEIATGRLLHIFAGLEGSLPDNAAVAFHPNGRLYFCSLGTVRVWEVVTGREVDSITLPDGLADVMKVTTDGRLLFLRRERGPQQSRPGTWVLRDLVGTDPAKPLHTQTDTNWSAYEVGIPAHGNQFVVVGQTRERVSREVFVVYDTATGRELWRDPHLLVGNSHPILSRDGSAVTVPGTNGTSRWLALSNGTEVAAGPFDLASDRYRLTGAPEGGAGLLHLIGSTNRLVLGAQYGLYREPVFSHDGRLLAWGTQQGVAVVAHLDEVERRLNEFGMKW